MLFANLSQLSALIASQNPPSLFIDWANVGYTYADTMSLHATSAWNEGETEMHSLLRAPHGQNPTSRGLPAGRYGRRVMQAPLVALGTLDEAGQPWTTVWGGERGFTRLIAEDVLGVNSAVARATDPVFQALFAGADADTGMVRPDPEGDEENGGGGGSGTAKMLSGLAIDMESRDRVKLAGRLLAGAAGPETEGRAQLAFAVTESLGNCPKYITKKSIVPHDAVDAEARIASEGFPLPREAVDLIDRADILFISSTDGRSMDTNNRGGPPGFMRVLRNDEGGVELIYPECMSQSYSMFLISPLANRLFAAFRLRQQAVPDAGQPQDVATGRHRSARL
jgi:predicted pyridoxine 5'-phosphate oxidase superfamily flavin-nucleotide-binding protein